MARRVAASYVEVLQTDAAAARVTQVSAEALTGAGAQKARVTQLSAEALFGWSNATVGGGTVTLGGTDIADSYDGAVSGYISWTQWTAAQAMSLTNIKFSSLNTVGTSVVQGAVYANNVVIPIGSALAQTATVTGVAAGTNSLELVTPLALSAGQTVWLGLIVGTANFQLRRAPTGGQSSSTYQSGATPGTPPTVTSPLTASGRYLIWGEGTGGTTTQNPAQARLTQLSAEILRTVGDNLAQARVTGLSLEVLLQVVPAATQRVSVTWVA
jgi:hypothetical protein